jgi:hypothetical protein
MISGCQTRRFFGGRQPLCGIGVTSVMLVTLKPALVQRAHGGLTAWAWSLDVDVEIHHAEFLRRAPARDAATCAANGVLLREPRKPEPPAVAHASALPWRSVIVMMVLLKDAWTWAIPSATCFLDLLLGTNWLRH